MYMLLIDGVIEPGKRDEFHVVWNRRILPLLKKQEGFVDEILLTEDGSGSGCMGLCFWNTQDQCHRYRNEIFPTAKGFVEHLLIGSPALRVFEVEDSEIFKIVSRMAA